MLLSLILIILADVRIAKNSEHASGGTLDMDRQRTSPLPAGARGDLAGSFPDAGVFFIAFRVNRVF
jgi:hypothetical protein